MSKKILLPLSLLALTSASVLASSESYKAGVNGWNEPTFAETTPLHFGKIRLAATSSCAMDNAGAVTGDCDAADAAIALGVVTVSGLAATSAMDITVTGSSSANLTFAATSTANDGTTNVVTADGVASAFTTDASATDIVINVYGSMTVDTALSAGVAYEVDYTVDVSFQ